MGQESPLIVWLSFVCVASGTAGILAFATIDAVALMALGTFISAVAVGAGGVALTMEALHS